MCGSICYYEVECVPFKRILKLFGKTQDIDRIIHIRTHNDV